MPLLALATLVSTTPAVGCAPVPPPSKPFAVSGFYKDAKGSVVDPIARAARDAAVAPYEVFVRLQQARADSYLLQQDSVAGHCAIDDLVLWAQHRALNGQWTSKQANYERNWYLGALAITYLKLLPLAEPDDRRRIAGWLAEMAATVAGFLTEADTPENNLTYWAGFALATTALAVDDAALDRQADTILAKGLAAVRADGTLPLEMARGCKSLDYHAFAAEPLVGMAFIETKRGHDFDLAALRRLVARILSGLADPAFFVAAAGAPQEQPAAWGLAWLGMFDAIDSGGKLPKYGQKTHFLGGDVAASMAVIARAAAAWKP